MWEKRNSRRLRLLLAKSTLWVAISCQRQLWRLSVDWSLSGLMTGELLERMSTSSIESSSR